MSKQPSKLPGFVANKAAKVLGVKPTPGTAIGNRPRANAMIASPQTGQVGRNTGPVMPNAKFKNQHVELDRKTGSPKAYQLTPGKPANKPTSNVPPAPPKPANKPAPKANAAFGPKDLKKALNKK